MNLPNNAATRTRPRGGFAPVATGVRLARKNCYRHGGIHADEINHQLMHTAQTARETLEFLWENYQLLCERVDLGAMPPDVLETHVEQNSPVRPFRIALWLARYGYFISAWTLWECYSRSLCQNLPNKEERAKKRINRRLGRAVA